MNWKRLVTGAILIPVVVAIVWWAPAGLVAALALVVTGLALSEFFALAELAGLGRAARWVGRSLSQLPPGTTLPWHRVIAASGRLSLPAGSVSGAEQRARLRAEGVLVVNDRVDIRRHGWRPMEHSG